MPLRFYIFFISISLGLLFYPGENPYMKMVLFERVIFAKDTKIPDIKMDPVPQIKNKNLPINLTAQGVYVVDLKSFTPVYKKNEHLRLYPASTTKVVTALVARDLYKIDDVVKITDPKTEGSTMGLLPQEEITVDNLLYGALIQSGNDAAYALAQAKGYDFFIEEMNKKAVSLGMKDSNFVNPAGLDDINQRTTAFDLSLAARSLLEDDYLRKVVGTKEITVSDVNYNYFHTLKNVNKLLGEIRGLGGLKTGYTDLAGENLISFYRHDGHDFIIVVMKSDDRFSDTKNIVEWIQNNIYYEDSYL